MSCTESSTLLVQGNDTTEVLPGLDSATLGVDCSIEVLGLDPITDGDDGTEAVVMTATLQATTTHE